MRKRRLTASLAAVATLAIGGSLAASVGTAYAFSTPPWQASGSVGPCGSAACPDSNEKGFLTFYNSAGKVVTSGTLESPPVAAYAVGSTADAAHNTAAMYVYTPVASTSPSAWTGLQLSTSTSYPNTSAPAPLNSTGSLPVATGAAGDTPLGYWTHNNSDASAGTGYANVYEIRVKTGTASYWAADIQVTVTGTTTVSGTVIDTGTWTQLFPTITQPNITLTGTATGTVAHGTAEVLTIHVPANSPSGSIQLYDGTPGPTTVLGSAYAYATNSSAQTFTYPTSGTYTPADGSHSYSAVYTPTPGSLGQDDTSNAVALTEHAAAAATNTAMSASPSSVNQYSQEVFTANVTDSSSAPFAAAGSVVFAVTPTGGGATTNFGPVSTNDGTVGEYKYTISSVTLATGTYNVVATFTPQDTLTYNASSSSPPTPLTVTAPACPGVPVNQDPSSQYYNSTASNLPTCSDQQTIQASVSPGSITITTPYTSSNPYVLPPLALTSDGTHLTTNAQFPKAGDAPIVVQSSLAGNPNWTVSVTATDLSCASGSCTTAVAGDFQSINGENLGLTGGAVVGANPNGPTATFPGTVTFTAIPAANAVTPSDSAGGGLKGGPHTFAQSVGGGNGSVSMIGTLTLNAPTATQSGTYTGLITFSVV